MGFTAMQLRSLPFGTIGTNTLAGTGTGLAQSVTDCAAGDALARHLQRHDRGDPHLLNTGERASSPLRSSPTDELRASHLRRRCLRQSSTFDPVAGADRSILASAMASPTVSCSGKRVC
jgi:hypothetical protein